MFKRVNNLLVTIKQTPVSANSVHPRKRHTLLSSIILTLSASTLLLGCQNKAIYVQGTTPVISSKITSNQINVNKNTLALFNHQLELLESNLASIEASNPNEIEWYFVGVAGSATQNVFRSELDYTKTLFDDKFHTQGRSINLINNKDSWKHEPIATKESIKTALDIVGQRMGEEDVLFLSMSSHGTRDVFQLKNYLIDIENIDPDWLRETLDNAGIKWRVIAISSCYSGSFIDELLNANTAIITAASKDRLSFGCSHTANMTYFGSAFFKNNLPKASSFEEAFINAVTEIKTQELSEGYEHSDPQMAVGETMKMQLPSFEKALFE